MTPEELAAIRARDAEAEVCSVVVPGRDYRPEQPCGHGRTHEWHRTEAACTAEFTDGSTCPYPWEHHDFVPGGIPNWVDDAVADRRALLAALDAALDLIAHLRVAN